MAAKCLICPDCFFKKFSRIPFKFKGLCFVSLGICVCLLLHLHLKQLPLALNTTSGYSNLLASSPEDNFPRGPWQYTGLWMGNDALVNNSIISDKYDFVKVYTGLDVHYLEEKITSARYSRYNLLSTPAKPVKVGDVVQFRIDARDKNGDRKSYGGDFWIGTLKDKTRNAYTAGRVTDFKNGTYLMTFVLAWHGKTDVEIQLLYPNKVTNWLRTRYRVDNHFPTWQGTFQKGKQKKISNCYLSYGRIPNNVCEYRNHRALQHTRFYCKKPAGFPCGNLVGHRNILPYGKVIANIMQIDHVDMFQGIERYKVIEGTPPTLNVIEQEDNLPPNSIGHLPRCGEDLSISPSDGFWMNHTWTSLVCQPNLQYSSTVVRNCLRNHNIHLTGDSTTRQWFFSLTNALNVNIPGGNDRTKMTYRYFSDPDLNLNLTFTFHPLTYQMSFIVDISEMRFETDVLLNLPLYTCNHVVVISPWTHFMTWPREAYIEWLTNIKRAIVEARKRCPGIKIVIKSPHAIENVRTSRSMMGVDVLFSDMKQEMRNIFEGSNVFFVDIWDMNDIYPTDNDMHMPIEVVNQEIALFLSYICH